MVSLSATSGVNVALSGTAMQSSTHVSASGNHYWDGKASKGIDGITNSDLSCTRTYSDLGPWWRVQLPSVYKVAEIEVTNRIFHPEELLGTDIFIGNSKNVSSATSR